ncbi:hypothetical protein lerEdw1_007522 [Lerista edwardsae]|nr:hypothetical protein lerEdw1_007522 [Lerista edwardsae]
MLSRKKARGELSKPGEVQGKYVIKETSPLLRNLMPSFIRHGPTIPRRTDICLPDPGSSAYTVSGDGTVSRNQSFLRTPVQRPPQEIMRRESNRLSAPSYLARSLAEVPRECGSSSQSFLTEANSVTENGDTGSRYYYDYFYNGQRRHPLGDHVQENYRCYEQNLDLFQRMSQNQGRHTSGKCRVVYYPFVPRYDQPPPVAYQPQHAERSQPVLVPANPYHTAEIPDWLQVYARAPAKYDHILKWELFQLADLDTYQGMLKLLFMKELERIVKLYEAYRQALLTELENRKQRQQWYAQQHSKNF